MAGYSFTPCIEDSDNWIRKYIDFAQACTDAPLEYHEAYGAFLLSIAAQGLKLQLQSVPKGMRTNLYLLIHGVSSKMRKSTAMLLAKEVQEKAFSGVRLPENFTPGGLEEEIADRNGLPSVLFVDEFVGVLDKMYHQSYMAGTRGFLLTMYSEENWKYTRRAKGGKKDNIIVEDSHLCIAGNVTPTVSRRLKEDDIEDGFLARFGVIMPQGKPPRRRLFELHTGDPRILRDVSEELRKIRSICSKLTGVIGNVLITPEALMMLDTFQEEVENQEVSSEIAEIMLERISDMSIKLAMIVAAGRPDGFAVGPLKIIEEDVRSAITLARRWAKYASDFTDTINKTEVEKYVRRVTGYLRRNNGRMAGYEIARRMKVAPRLMDEIETAMLQRNMLRLEDEVRGKPGTRPTLMWVLHEPPSFDEDKEALVKKILEGVASDSI